MAYKTMKTLISNYKAGRCSFTKEKLMSMCDVYYGAGRLADSEYAELIAELETLD